MSATAEVKRASDLVKLVNTGEKAVDFIFNSIGHVIPPKKHKVVTREVAEHGIDKTLIPQVSGEGQAQIKDYVSPLVIEELPYDKRSAESLGQSAEEAKQLTGEVHTLKKLIDEKDQIIKDLITEIAGLKSKAKKHDK